MNDFGDFNPGELLTEPVIKPMTTTVTTTTNITASTASTTKPKRGQANKRERVRTENVNAGFDNLRKLIPTDPENRKLSKIEVLRLATSYINHLYNLTRANSCLEAESIGDEEFATSGSDEDDDDGGRDEEENRARAIAAAKSNYKRNKYHVCTFCLMMTKFSTATTNTSNSNTITLSTKRK